MAEKIKLAHRALELAPRFCPAAFLAAVGHMQNVIWGYADDPQFDRREAVRLSRLALSLDDSDPDTLASAAVISVYSVDEKIAVRVAAEATPGIESVSDHLGIAPQTSGT